jgi:predicted metal-binding membrane protein
MSAVGPRSRTPAAVLAAIVAAWAAAGLAHAAGQGAVLHGHSAPHDAAEPLWVTVLLPPFWMGAVAFLLAWQVMVAAMMLPSSLPMVRLFVHAARRQEGSNRIVAAFLGGYAAVWAGCGAAAFAADVAVHRAGGAFAWLDSHPWLAPAAALAGAGAFQFSGLKDRCLDQCRHPGPFLMRHYRRGTRGGFDLGRRHGVFCIGCCWALMALMLVMGAASLVWMAGLGAVMYYERAGRHGRRLTPVVGVLLIAWGLVVAAHPGWLPGILGGVAS